MASSNSGEGSNGAAAKSPKKANLLDQHSMKHLLDESVSEVRASLVGRGRREKGKRRQNLGRLRSSAFVDQLCRADSNRRLIESEGFFGGFSRFSYVSVLFPLGLNAAGYPEDVRVSNLRLLVGVVIIAVALLAQFYPKKFPGNKSFLIICIGLYLMFNALLLLISYTKEKEAILFTYPPSGSFTSTGLVVSSKLPRFSDMYTLTIASADPKSVSANKPVQLTRSVTKWFTKDGILVEGLLWKDVEKLIDDYATDRKSKSYSSTLETSH